MIGFGYHYNSYAEIMTQVWGISSQSFLDILHICLALIVFFLLSFIALPFLILWYKNKLAEKDKLYKKRLLTQILLQKEIEDEVEQEIQIEEQEKFQN